MGKRSPVVEKVYLNLLTANSFENGLEVTGISTFGGNLNVGGVVDL